MHVALGPLWVPHFKIHLKNEFEFKVSQSWIRSFENRGEGNGKGPSLGLRVGGPQPREVGGCRLWGEGSWEGAPSSSPSPADARPGPYGRVLSPLRGRRNTGAPASRPPARRAPPGTPGRGRTVPEAGGAGSALGREGEGPAAAARASTGGGAAGGARSRGGGFKSRRSSRMVAASRR